MEGSKPLEVKGDVFLLEKPSVSTYRITINDIPKYLQDFKHYYNKSDNNPIIKVFHKENSPTKKYDIYVDFAEIFKLNSLDIGPIKPILDKLENFVLQFIPSSLKIMIYLPDEGSKLLAEFIKKILMKHGIDIQRENIFESNSKSLPTPLP